MASQDQKWESPQDKILKKIGLDYDSLPQLVRDETKDPHLRVYHEEMTAPIMRHKRNPVRFQATEPTIIIAIKGHSNERMMSFKKAPLIRNIKGTLELYLEPLLEDGDELLKSVFMVETPDEIKWAYNDYHDRNGHVGKSINQCPTCPIIGPRTRFDLVWLENLINGKDPIFKVGL